MGKPKSVEAPTAYDEWFKREETAFNLPPGLLKAISWEESRHDPKAVAPQFDPKTGEQNGGRGLMQFVRTTAEEYGIDPFNPEKSIRAAAEYLSKSLRASNNDIKLAVQSYNMGLGGAREFFAGKTGVRGDPEYYKKVFNSLEKLNGKTAAAANAGTALPAATPAPAYVPKTDREAAQISDIQAASLEPVTDPGLSPKQTSWVAELGDLGMTAKLNGLFASANAEHERAARTGRAQLESLLDEGTA